MHEALSRARFQQEVAAIPAAVCRDRRWKIHAADYPLLDIEYETTAVDARPGLRLKMDFTGWNDLPPSIVLLRPDGTAINQILPPLAGTNVFHAGPHPAHPRPFVCMQGSREYHTHPSHVADLWDNYRNSANFNLGGIVTQIWQAWKKDRP